MSTVKHTINAYINAFPPDVRSILQTIRTIVQEEAPEAKECIKYGIPTFTMNGNLVHFAAFNTHIGFYPTPSGISAFAQELGDYKQAKGSVQFPLDQEMPFDLMRKIVRYRVKEQSS